MSLTLSTATAGRVLTQIRHDPRTIALLLVVPSLLIGLMAWLFADTPIFNRVGPAMLALFPFTVMFVVSSISTLRERRSGTLQRLLTLPLGKLDFILGYALSFAVLAVLQASIAVTFAVWVLDLQVVGPIWHLLLVALANGVLGSTMGLLASAFAQTEFQVVQFMPAIVFPQILLGGVILPRSDMPSVLNAISDWLPLSHAIDAMNAVATGTEPDAYLFGKLLIILAFAVGAVILGASSVRRRSP